MRRWFLSYNSQDLALMQGLEAALRRKDPDAHIFFAPKSLRAGGYWLPALADAIAEATAFVLLVGEKGVGPWQVTEYYEALDKSVKVPSFPVILVLLEGAPAPGLKFLGQLHWVVTPDPASEESIAKLLDATVGPGTQPGELWRYTAPYRGLAAMTEADSEFFFGRGRATVEVLRALEAAPDRLPVLVGNSGVGKSSLAQAGALACLKRQAWPERSDAASTWPQAFRDSRRWCFLKLNPGTDPLKALVEPFLDTWQFGATDPERVKQQNGWIELLRGGKATLGDLLDATERRHAELGQTKPPAFFLYVDQGEELYVRAEEREQRRFSELLAHGLGDPRLRALMSLRADFFGALQSDEPLYAVHRQINVPPLREVELQEVVSRPAALLSARFETDGLAADLARRTAEESAKDAGALPVLSYLLDDMWTQMVRRGDGVLRLPAHAVELGGVLAERANAFLASHPNAEGHLRRILTLKLATVREDGEPTRRRGLRSEFSDAEWRLVSELADHPHRLLITATPEQGETYAEVAHEAIFRRWEKLREWMAAEREFLIWMSQLEADRRRWAAAPAASKQDALLMGLALEEAQRWLAKRGDDLPKANREFIELSLQREKLERGRRLRQRRYRVVSRSIAAALVLLLAAGGFYGWDQFLREKSAYYQAMIWRWGLPEGLGLLDPETRSHREVSFHVIIKAGKVREVRRESSGGTLQNDSDGVARWEVVYRDDGTADRLRLFRREGPLIHEEVFKGKNREIIDFEGGSEGIPMMQEAVRTLFLDPSEQKERVEGKTKITRHKLQFDANGFLIERRFQDQYGVPQKDAQGSYGQRFNHTAEGLVSRRAEIDLDGNEITLKTGLRAVISDYDTGYALRRETQVGEDGNAVNGAEGWAFYAKDYDRWGNDTDQTNFRADGSPALKQGWHRARFLYDDRGNNIQWAFFGIEGRPALHKDGYAVQRRKFDERGNIVEEAYFGVDGQPILLKDGYAISRAKFDERGNLIQLAYFGVDGQPILLKDGYAVLSRKFDERGNLIQLAYFGVDGQPILLKDGYAISRAKFDERGNAIEVAYFGVDDQPTLHKDGFAVYRRKFDERGNIIEVAYFGVDGQPILKKDGYAIIQQKFDERSNLTEIAYFGVDGQAILHKDGYAVLRRKFDERGNVIEEAYFGVDGQAILHKDGYAVARAKFDARGNAIEVALFGIDGKPILHKDGYAVQRRKFDERGNAIEVALLGIDGKPILHNDGHAVIRRKFDERGNVIEAAYFGVDGRPILIKDGYAISRAKFDERGNLIQLAYFGVDGQPILHKAGYAISRAKFEERGNIVEEAYFGVDGRPILIKDGFAVFRQKFDARGNLIEVAYFGVDGRPTLHKDGYAGFRSVFDERGNKIEESTFGIEGKPILQKDGYAKATWTFDARGNLIEAAYFGVEGQPILTKDGYAIIREKFDERGNVIEVAYFGVDGQPILVEDGYAVMRQKFDERGKEIERAFFGVDGKPTLLRTGYSRIATAYDELGRVIRTRYFDAENRGVALVVVVRAVLPGSTAERIALAPGDRIVSYNGEKIASAQQFVQLVADARGPASRVLVIRRGPTILTFEVPAGRVGINIEATYAEAEDSPRE